MRIIKLFENYKPWSILKGDIESIFVELKDLGYQIYVAQLSDCFLVKLSTPPGIDMGSYDKVNLVKECILMYNDYIRDYFDNYNVDISYEYHIISRIGTKVEKRRRLDFSQLNGPVTKIGIIVKTTEK
jgi:hypothetical protein